MPRRADQVCRRDRGVGQGRRGADDARRGDTVVEERHEPVVDFVERRGRQAVVAMLTSSTPDEFRFAEHLQVLRHGRLTPSSPTMSDTLVPCSPEAARSRRSCRMSRRVPSAITSEMSAM